jgi:hypothetical protein
VATQLSLRIPHRMGPEQALNRIRTLATGAKREYADRIDITQELWFTRGCIFAFTLHLYGKRRVSGTLAVDPSFIRLEGSGEFPSFMRPRIERVLEREARRLLGRTRKYH